MHGPFLVKGTNQGGFVSTTTSDQNFRRNTQKNNMWDPTLNMSFHSKKLIYITPWTHLHNRCNQFVKITSIQGFRVDGNSRPSPPPGGDVRCIHFLRPGTSDASLFVELGIHKWNCEIWTWDTDAGSLLFTAPDRVHISKPLALTPHNARHHHCHCHHRPPPQNAS